MKRDIFTNKSILVTGGTGSLGRALVKRILSGKHGTPESLTVFSRDEEKQHNMRLELQNKNIYATDEVIYSNFNKLLKFRIGDVRDYHSIYSALRGMEIVINAAAMKQVPACEYFPYESVLTNTVGAKNIVKVIEEHNIPVETVVGTSTDKACKPINVYGMTKAIGERILIHANLSKTNTKFVCVRYGNVLASRGSVLLLFREQIERGGPVTVTDINMTRFLLPLEEAVDIVIASIDMAEPGDVLIPKLKSAKIYDLAKVLIGNRDIKIKQVGIRPGEKLHEILVSEEEVLRTYDIGKYLVIKPILPELKLENPKGERINVEYSSADTLMKRSEINKLLKKHWQVSSKDRVSIKKI